MVTKGDNDNMQHATHTTKRRDSKSQAAATTSPPGKLTLDKSTYASMVAMFCAKRGPTDEVEAVYTEASELSRATVVRLLVYMRSSFPGARPVDISNTLDVSRSRGAHGGGAAIVRVTVQGDAAIRDALEHGKWNVPAASAMVKDRVRPAVTVRDYRMRLNLKEETPMSDVERASELRGIPTAPGKTFRMKRRFGFLVDGDLRVDITAVRQITSGAAVPTYSRLQGARENYEVEIEYVGGEVDQARAEASVKMLMRHHSVLLKVIDDTDVLMTPDQRATVIREYATLVVGSGVVGGDDRQGCDGEFWKISEGGGAGRAGRGGPPPPRVPFVGPKPATLEMSHLMLPSDAALAGGSISVREGYTVTDKADGERRLLFIGADRRAYTINDRLEVRATGLGTRARMSCLLDGEWVLGRFMCFDAYFLDGRDVRGLPLMNMASEEEPTVLPESRKTTTKKNAQEFDRLSVAAAVIADFPPGASVVLKEFRPIRGGNDVFKQAAYFLLKRAAHNFAYEVDGLIFTPAASPVPRKGGLSWPEVLKWKPPHQNTIDFLVRMRPADELVVHSGQTYTVADLKVGYDPDKWEPITAMAFLTGEADGRFAAGNQHRRPGTGYIEKPFAVPGGNPLLHVCHLPRNDDGCVRCANGDEISDGAVVEFAFAGNDSGGFGWKPIRVRHDKVEKMAATGGITANDYGTAINIWRTIECPVTADIMNGKEPIVTCADTNDKYYAKKIKPGEGETSDMRRFHNWLKKEFLLQRVGAGIGARSLFDFGVGRGGDLRGWAEMGLQRVVGIDKDPGGLTDPFDGAYSRVLKWRIAAARRGEQVPRVAFLAIDAAVPLGGEQMLASFSDIGDRTVAQTLWGIARPGAIPPALRPYHRFAVLGGFDVASCMFAVHYFFDTPERLDALCANVSAVLRPGGIFAGVCLDGRMVQDALDEAPDGKIQGKSADGRKLLWSIERKYEKPMAPHGSFENTGRQVDVFMETIGHAMPEYLVDYFLLVKAMAKRRMVPLSSSETAAMQLGQASTGMFRDVHSAEVARTMAMTDAEKQYSFLNRWFVFRKTDADVVPLAVTK